MLSAPATTNNKMELRAVIEGLKKLRYKCDVTIVTDSQYVMKGITEWINRWQRNGWKNVKKEDVKNKNLWQALLEETRKHHVSWQWIRGHSGHPQNERCDELAKNAINTIKQ